MGPGSDAVQVAVALAAAARRRIGARRVGIARRGCGAARAPSARVAAYAATRGRRSAW